MKGDGIGMVRRDPRIGGRREGARAVKEWSGGMTTGGRWTVAQQAAHSILGGMLCAGDGGEAAAPAKRGCRTVVHGRCASLEMAAGVVLVVECERRRPPDAAVAPSLLSLPGRGVDSNSLHGSSLPGNIHSPDVCHSLLATQDRPQRRAEIEAVRAFPITRHYRHIHYSVALPPCY